jgi:hypothetical protein
MGLPDASLIMARAVSGVLALSALLLWPLELKKLTSTVGATGAVGVPGVDGVPGVVGVPPPPTAPGLPPPPPQADNASASAAHRINFAGRGPLAFTEFGSMGVLIVFCIVCV